MQEEKDSSGEDEVVEVSPKRTTNPRTKERREEDESEEIEGSGSCEVELRLQIRVDGPEDVDYTEARGMKKEKNNRMAKCEEDGAVGGPLMKSKDIDVSMGPSL